MRSIHIIPILLFLFVLFSYSSVFAVDPTPTLPPLPTPTQTVQTDDPCADNSSVYPPNSECYPKVDYVESDITQYPLTCISAPNITFSSTVTGFVPPSSIDVTVVHDLSNATLGGFGPNLEAMRNSGSSDVLAKQYMFSSLFDKPNYSLNDVPREAWRTYWRLLTAKQQANVKSAYLKSIGALQKNVSWHYYDKNGQDQKTNAEELKNDLSKYFGFVDGCLTQTPVCEEFTDEYLQLPENVKNKYDTLMPFDFDNLRSFIVLGGDVAKENIPYLEAILSGISGNRGLFSHLTPSWSIVNPNNILTTSDENSLLSQIISRASTVACPFPSKTSYLSSPKTYPNKNLQQTIKVPVSAVEISKTPDRCTGPLYYCPYLSTKSLCETYKCKWIIGESEYQVTGSATGQPMAVLNNPKVNQITDMVAGNADKKIPSFVSMLLPSFVKLPIKSLIGAPIVTNTSNSPQVTINGDNTIYRENNLAQESLQSLQNCWLLPSDGQSSSQCNKPQKTLSSCNGELMAKYAEGLPTPSAVASSFFSTYILPNLNVDVMSAYAEAETETGVPCEVLAGIHYEEASNNPGRSLQDGSPLKTTLAKSAIAAANELKGKAGGEISDIDTLVRALSYYNGGGNTNCQDNYSCPAAQTMDRCGLTIKCAYDTTACVCRPGLTPEAGSCRASCNPYSFPWTFSYSYCPASNIGYADPYVVNWWQSPQHDNMYLLYQYDCTRTRPFIHTRPGSLTVALSLYFYNK